MMRLVGPQRESVPRQNPNADEPPGDAELPTFLLKFVTTTSAPVSHDFRSIASVIKVSAETKGNGCA
ncbi:MAG: hypothetical protein IPH10_08285 [bacterium]|nr:hypothetical protein [bacterium]